jgi:hypothetical protein
MSESLVSRFQSSASFAEAKSNIALLEQAVYWNEQLSEAIGMAVAENNQIEGSFGVAIRVVEFVKKRTIQA